MKFLLLILGIGCGSAAAFFGYPYVEPKLNPGLGAEDLIPLVPLGAEAATAPDTPTAPAQPEKPPSPPPAPVPPKPEAPRPEAVKEPKHPIATIPRPPPPPPVDKIRPADRDAEEHLRAGRRLYREGDFQKAAAEFDAALKLSPNNPAALKDLGATYARAGDGEKAIAAYRAFLKVVPKGKDADAIRKVLAAAGAKP